MAFADGPAKVQNGSSERSPASITWAVWKALFLREAVARLFAGRMILVEREGHLVL